MHTGLQGHLTGGHLNRGLPGTFRGGFRGGILRGLPGTEGLEGIFRELTGLRGGGHLKGGLKGGLKVTLKGGLKGGYLKVTLRGGLRGGLRSP